MGLKRAVAWILTLCLLAMGLLAGCGDQGDGKGFRFPLAAEPVQLDPQVSTDSSSITLLSVLFEGLARLDEDGLAVPGAAEWTVSPDGRTYTFTLRESYWSALTVRGEDHVWENPMLVVADDFVFGLQRSVSPDTGSELAQQLYDIENAQAVHEGKKPASALGVRAVSDNQLTITLTAADASFPAKLASTPFMPCNREFFAYTAGRYGLEKQYVLTNGPFSLQAWNHNQSLLLYKNPYYHGADDVTPQAVRFVIDADASVQALEEGTMDVAALAPGQVEEARRAGLQIVALQDTVRSLWFNTADETLSNVSVRQALRDAVEWDTVRRYLETMEETPATGFAAPDARLTDGGSCRTQDTALSFVTDAEKAQRELGAGLAALYPEKASPSLPTLTVLAAQDEDSANLARYLIQSWQKNLNIYSNLQLLEESKLAARVKSGQYQVAIYTATAAGLTGAENLQSYTTGAAGNYCRFSAPAFDKAVTAAMRGGRTEFQAAERLLLEQCPLLPLSFVQRYYAVAGNSEGIVVRPFDGGVYGSPFAFLQAKKWDS